MPTRRVVRAEDARAATRARAATLVDACWPRRGDGAGFRGVRATREREGTTRCARFVLEVSSDADAAGDDAWRCAGACVIEDSCAVLAREGAKNGMMRSVVVDDAMRRAGHGAALVRGATSEALTMGWDIITVWCERGWLVNFYERCGYVYEPAKGRGYAEEEEAVLRATRESVRDTRGIRR